MQEDKKSFLDELERLTALREAGHLTEDEFNAAKQQLLNSSPAKEDVPNSESKPDRPARRGRGSQADGRPAASEYYTVRVVGMVGQTRVMSYPNDLNLDEIRNLMGAAGW